MTPLARGEALARLSQVVVRERLVTLTGPGGIGKTTLARAALDQLRADGLEAWFVDAVHVESSAALLVAIAAGLELAPGRDGEAVALDEYFGRREAWLIVDNLENLVPDDVAETITRRLTAAPGLHVLATSRVMLGAADEVQIPVPGLGLPSSDDPEVVAASPAGALFVARAHAVGAAVDLTSDAAELAAILRQLDGMPLAIELAAGRARVLALPELRRRLDDPSTLAGPAGTDNRHRSLATVLAWSIAMLDDEQRRVLDAAAACPGPFDVEVLEALAHGADVVAALDVLVGAGLVKVDGDHAGRRWFRVLETIRAACLRALDEAHIATLGARLAAHVDRRAEAIRVDLRSGGQVEAAALAGRLRPLIDATMTWALDHDPALGLRVVTALDRYWRLSGWDSSPMRWLDRLLADAAPDDPSRPYAEVVRIEQVLVVEGPVAALPVAVRALELARAAGVRHVVRRAYTASAQVYGNLGEWVTSARCLIDAAAWSDDPDDRSALLEAGEANLAIAEGRDAEARAQLLSSLAAQEHVGDRWNAAVTLLLCAMVEWRMGDDRGSAATAQRAEALMQAFDTPGDGRPVIIAALGNAGLLDEACVVLAAAWSEVERAHLVARIELLEAAVPMIHEQGRSADALAVIAAVDRLRMGTGWARDILIGWLVDEHRAAIVRELDPVAAGLARHDGETMDVYEAYALAVAQRAPGDGPRPAAAHRTFERLTTREVEVLAMVGSGQSDAEIADALYISRKTASVHVSNVKGKLGLASRLEVALRAREMGLVAEAGRRADVGGG